MKITKQNEAFVWPCPKCGAPMEIIPAHDNVADEEIVVVACWCGYSADYVLRHEEVKE